MAKAAHREVVQYRDLLLLQKVFISSYHKQAILMMKVETISEAQRTGWNLAATSLSDTAQVLKYVSSFDEAKATFRGSYTFYQETTNTIDLFVL